MKKILPVLAFVSALSACGSNERVSREVFEQATKSMEVKKLSEADIVREALVWGDEISAEAQRQLLASLQQAISENGIPAAIATCQTQALPILAEVSGKNGLQVRRVSFDFRNPEDKPDSSEASILDAYTYNAENNLPSEANIQKIGTGDVLLYSKAIHISSAMCLNCHGTKGTDILPETQKALDELYPEDKAHGYQMGDLRGMWSVLIPKKEIVNRL